MVKTLAPISRPARLPGMRCPFLSLVSSRCVLAAIVVFDMQPCKVVIWFALRQWEKRVFVCDLIERRVEKKCLGIWLMALKTSSSVMPLFRKL